MRIAIYGGSFNPPHRGHIDAAQTVLKQLKPDLLLLIPSAVPPHKDAPENSPDPDERMHLTRLASEGLSPVLVSDMEIRRGGASYTWQTLRELAEEYPGSELILVVGTDMLVTFDQWREYRRILEKATLAALPRDWGDEVAIEAAADNLRKNYGARVILLPKTPLPMSSGEIRSALAQRGGRALLPGSVYAEIIRKRLYGAKPDLDWLWEQALPHLGSEREAHTKGCWIEAVRLAERWGADAFDAAEAAILHDLTKKLKLEEQLILCRKYDILVDSLERENVKLLHAKTGAALAKDLFGVPEPTASAILWHTTARPGMTLLEKILYLADYIEPTRDFEGLAELRGLAYEDIDGAMILGLTMSLRELEDKGQRAHESTETALHWFLTRRERHQ